MPPLQFTGPDDVRRNFIRWFDEYDGPIGLEVQDLSVVTSADVAFANKWVITHEHISIPTGWTA